jgi:DNA-directed RNA polymerase subunit RPC12/RpoP
MIEFNWKCPKCGKDNIDDADEAQDYTLECSDCRGEFEVICNIHVEVESILQR